MKRGTKREGPAEPPQEGGAPLPLEMRSLGYPHSRKNGGHRLGHYAPTRSSIGVPNSSPK